MQKPSRDSNYIEHIGSYQTGAKESVTMTVTVLLRVMYTNICIDHDCVTLHIYKKIMGTCNCVHTYSYTYLVCVCVCALFVGLTCINACGRFVIGDQVEVFVDAAKRRLHARYTMKI